ncbi:MAG: hypothetical protein ACRBBN_20155 [Methyloligellaceae bacterium]
MGKLLKILMTIVALAGLTTAASAQQGFRPIDVTNWKPENSETPLDLIASLYKGFPEALEGKPKVNINLTKNEDGKSFLIRLEMTGYLDDHTDGERYRAVVVRDGDKWRLKSLGKQWKCYRGSNKGWHTKICP